ncbi:MAG: hypothetical protein JNM76_10030 [Betaproteobacteria bacterium]|nr:hypothetical protein [Betaproteobacteria bacterium]
MADNEAMQAENVGSVAHYYGIPKLTFAHPARTLILDCFPSGTGDFRNVVLTGTAGEGKTSLCFELVQELTGRPANGHGGGVEQIQIESPAGPRSVTLIYDVTGWRKKTNGSLTADHVDVLRRMAESSFAGTNEFFVLAVNDGQMHELFRSLPDDAPQVVRQLQKELIGLHARGDQDSGSRLRMINLSTVPSEKIMELCLGAVLDRPEWCCLSEESESPLFSASSSLSRNYARLNTAEVRSKLVTLARIADVTGHHLPTRGVLCLLTNALLGHPDAKDRVLKPGAEANAIVRAGSAHRAALHRTLFGENLPPNARRKREIYGFLSMLHIGDETTNDLDELLIFGARDQTLAASYRELVAPDPFMQRSPEFDNHLTLYIRGDFVNQEETAPFLGELAAERRRVFLQASPQQMNSFRLWQTTVFHHAREYLDEVLLPLSGGHAPSRLHLRRLASGLTRIWTGLLTADQANEVYLATGLDLTTSPVSDIYLAELGLDSDPVGLEIVLKQSTTMPEVVLRRDGKEFRFALSLPRFEFLCRVADGAMPSSFSRESCADFMSLKQRCLRDLQLRPNSKSLHLLEIHGAGMVHKHPIYLPAQ